MTVLRDKFYPFENDVLKINAEQQIAQSVFGLPLQADSLPIVLTGTTTGADSLTTLEDSGATFVTDGVAEGDIVYNSTDGSIGIVKTVTSETSLVITALVGGTDQTWETGDSYAIRGLPKMQIFLTTTDGISQKGLYERNAGNTAWVKINRGVITIGGVGSGADYECDNTNVKSQFELAIAAVFAEGGGKILVFNKGSTYNLAADEYVDIDTQSNIEMIFENGAQIKRHASSIYEKSFRVVDSDDVKLYNLQIDNNESGLSGTSDAALSVSGCDDLVIEDITIINTSQVTANIVDCQRPYINNVKAYSYAQVQFCDSLRVSHCFDINIGSVFLKCGDDGLVLTNCSGNVGEVVRESAYEGAALHIKGNPSASAISGQNHDIFVNSVYDRDSASGARCVVINSGDATQDDPMKRITINSIYCKDVKYALECTSTSTALAAGEYCIEDLSVNSIICEGGRAVDIGYNTQSVKNLNINSIMSINAADNGINIRSGQEIRFGHVYIYNATEDAFEFGGDGNGIGTIDIDFLVIDTTGTTGEHGVNWTGDSPDTHEETFFTVKGGCIKNCTGNGFNSGGDSPNINLDKVSFIDNAQYGHRSGSAVNDKLTNCRFNGNTLGAIDGTPAYFRNNEGYDDQTVEFTGNTGTPTAISKFVQRAKIITVGGANAFTLADGAYDGQQILLYFKTDGGDATVTFNSADSVVFDDAGDTALLLWINGDWQTLILNT